MDATWRRIARDNILALSAMAPDEFVLIAQAKHVIPLSDWKFEEYHSAAAAAVQEDIKLNRIIYKLVPKKLEESEFWRLYFSQVLYVLASVKEHGMFPPPPPPPPPPPAAPAQSARGSEAKPRFPQPGTRLVDECAVM